MFPNEKEGVLADAPGATFCGAAAGVPNEKAGFCCPAGDALNEPGVTLRMDTWQRATCKTHRTATCLLLSLLQVVQRVLLGSNALCSE